MWTLAGIRRRRPLRRGGVGHGDLGGLVGWRRCVAGRERGGEGEKYSRLGCGVVVVVVVVVWGGRRVRR